MNTTTPTARHLLFHLPSDWTNDQRGDFFETFVAEILRPMRFKVEQRLRVTGMEIDLLAKGLDQPRKVLVECKAQRDALPADTISKLLGNVAIRGADAGWLFSTSELSKDGRGQWEEIQSNPDLASKFAWYPPAKLIDILIDQGNVVDPLTMGPELSSLSRGDATLVCSPSGKKWLLEILEDGFPAFFSVFYGPTGAPVAEVQAAHIAKASDRFASLTWIFAVEEFS